MLTLSDSGCSQHRPQNHSLTGLTAVLVGRLVTNLPIRDEGYSYICEYGHTHLVILHYQEEAMTQGPPGSRLAANRVTANQLR